MCHDARGERVLLFAGPMFEDLELLYPLYRLREEGAEVTVAGLGDDSYEGKKGHPVQCDTSAESVSAVDFDAVVIPGGYLPDHLRRSKKVLEITREAHDAGKPVAAICHAAWVPISAGIAKGKRMTSYWSIRDDVVNAGADWLDEEVVVDGNLITSQHPGDLPAFCRALIRQLGSSRQEGRGAA